MVIIDVAGNGDAVLRKFAKMEINRETRIKAEHFSRFLKAVAPALLSLLDRHASKMNWITV